MNKSEFWQKSNALVELEWYNDAFNIDANMAFKNAFYTLVMEHDVREGLTDELINAMLEYHNDLSLKLLAEYLMNTGNYEFQNITEVAENGEKFLHFERKEADR